MNREELREIREKLKNHLSPKRYEHSIGVEYTAAALAMCYGKDMIQAQLAGILHDCAKNIPHEELIKLCKKAGIELDQEQLHSPQILHAVYGPYMAKKEFGIEDEEVLSAIRWHTTGGSDMSVLDQIIYVADYIEPGRKYIEGMDEIRKTAFRDLPLSVYKITQNTIDYLQKKGQYIDKMTLDCLYWLEERYGYGRQQKYGKNNL